MKKERLIKVTKWFVGIIIGIVALISTSLYVFKDKICGYVIDEVNVYLNAKVAVSKVDLTFWTTFPFVSVDFNDVYIQDALPKARVTDTLLFSEKIRLKFNPIDLWNEKYHVKTIDIKPGSLQLKVNSLGEVNYNIFKVSTSKEQTAFDLQLQNVALENMRFKYCNEATKQYYSTQIKNMQLKGDFNQDRFSLQSKSELFIHHAKSGKVALVKNKNAHFDIGILVDQIAGTIEVPNAVVHLSNLPFYIKGKVDTSNFLFELHSKDLELSDLVNNLVLPQNKNIERFEGDGKVGIDLYVKGKNESETPANLLCDFHIANGSLREPLNNLKIENIRLNGKYSNQDGNESAFLSLNDVYFKTPGGPFSGKLKITQFDKPIYQGSAKGNLNLSMIHSIFNLPMVEDIKGDLGVQTDFKISSIFSSQGEIEHNVDRCEGEVQMKQISLKLEHDKRNFEQVNGSMFLRNDQAGISNVSLKIGRSDLAINGVFSNIIDYFKNQGKLSAELDLVSDKIDLADLGTTTKEEKIQDARKFVIPQDVEAEVYLSVQKLYYETHTFSNINSTMTWVDRKFNFPDITITNAGAQIQGALSIEERSAEMFFIETKVNASQINFKSIFKEWDNFQQEVIDENNISGSAQTYIHFKAPFDLRSGIVLNAIESQIDLKIQDGRLKNVEAFRSITQSLKSGSTKLFLGEENIDVLEQKLNDLKFEALENTISIKNGKIEIPKMFIHSSAMDLVLSGTHTFNNEVNYRFVFQLRDFKRKDKQTEFGYEEDDGTGMLIYMRMYGDLDHPKIEWDKEAKKQQGQANRIAEKQEIKSILKSEFGLFSKDSTVRSYSPKNTPKERVVLDMDDNPILNEPQKKKDGKIQNKLKQWKSEQAAGDKESIEFNEE